MLVIRIVCFSIQCFNKNFAKRILYAQRGLSVKCVNPLPHMPILGSSNLAANKDMMSKILTNGDGIS